MLSVFLKTCTLCESPRLQTHGHFLDIGSSTAISAESRGRCRSSRARRQTAFRDSVPASVLARAPRGPLPAPRLVVLEHAPVPGGGAWSPKPPLCISLASERVLSVAFASLLPRAAPTLTRFARVSSPGCVWISLRSRSRGEEGGRAFAQSGGDRGVCRGPGCLSAATQPRGEATRAPAHFPLCHQTLNYLSLGRSGRLARPPWKPDPPPDPHRRGPRET